MKHQNMYNLRIVKTLFAFGYMQIVGLTHLHKKYKTKLPFCEMYKHVIPIQRVKPLTTLCDNDMM